jgi:uncharacterized protein (DUF362 family)
MSSKTVIVKTIPEYPQFPYSPHQKYPEYSFSDISENSNYVYEAIRESFKSLDLDILNFGKENWNPLGEIVAPGNVVLIKPNWVRDFNGSNSSIDSLVTHTSFLRCIIDYVLIALKGRGKIILADAPIQECNFENLKQKLKLEELLKFYQKENINVPIEIKDWRLTILKKKIIANKFIDFYDQEHIDNEENFYLIDLKEESFFSEINPKYYDILRVTMYNPKLLLSHHKEKKHEYLITKDIFECDVFINLSKMKTHKKAGLTASLKNIVGINGHKEFLPHHRKGSKNEGGDAYFKKCYLKRIYENIYDYYWERFEKSSWFKNIFLRIILKALLKVSKFLCKDQIHEGNWMGNDTIWRTILDLNKILFQYDPSMGGFRKSNREKILNITDGIIAGEGEGPLSPSDKKTGIVTLSFNPAINDLAISKLMGYDPYKIPTIYNAFYNEKSPFFDSEIIAKGLNNTEIVFLEKERSFLKAIIKIEDLPNLKFKPPKFWREAMAKL